MNRSVPGKQHQAAFTLIEVMVALAIAAISLAAVTAAMSQMVDAANSMQDRTYASWIAQNRIAELRLANVIPEVSEDTDDLEYAGRQWTWRTSISETGVENLFRVDVAVSFEGSDDVIRTVTGFVGEPSVPGQANIAWSSASFGIDAPPEEDEEPGERQ